MSSIRSIEKHYPMHLTSISGSTKPQFAGKCQCQDWLELHNAETLYDIVSLPSSMKMAQLYFSIDESKSQTGKTEYYFKRERNIWRGVVSDNGMNIEEQLIKIDNSILMSNAVTLESGRICNFSIDKFNNSTINVIGNNVEGYMSSEQYQMDWPIANYSNIIKGQQQTLMFVSEGAGQQNLMSYNLETQSIEICMSLPEIELPTCTQCFTLPQNSPYSNSSQLICVWGRSWLGIADTRTSTLVSMQPLSYCESAMTINKLGSTVPKILYSEESKLFQYDIRKGSSRRNPFLTHSHPISSCTRLGDSVLAVQDGCSSAIHLYSVL